LDAGDLEHDASRLDVGDPPLDRTLAGAHADLGRLLGERTIGVDVDEHLAATLHVAGHGDTSRLDLTVGDVRRRERLDAVVAERQLGAALGHAAAGRVVLLAVLGPARDQHVARASVPGCCAGAAACSGGAAVCGADSLLSRRAAALRSLRRPRGRSARGPRPPERGPCEAACWAASSLAVTSPL